MIQFDDFLEIVESQNWDLQVSRQTVIEYKSKKAIYLFDSIVEKRFELAESIEKLKISNAEFSESNKSGDNLILAAISVAQTMSSIYSYFLPVVELISLLRDSEVLSVLLSIDINQTVDQFNAIDVKLNEFVRHNHLDALNAWDKYPESIIKQAREQLKRISLNYGRESEFKKKGDLYTDFGEIIEFPVDIFLTQENYKLFIYLVEKYATGKRPVDLSQIYRWLEDKGMIKQRSGIEFRNFLVSQNLVLGKFAKIVSKNPDSQTVLNELYKKFISKG